MTSRKISIHIEPSERSLNRVDLPVAVVIQFLEMIVGQFRGLGIRRASRLTIMSWVVARRIFEDSVVRQVWVWLNHCLSLCFLASFALPMHRASLLLSISAAFFCRPRERVG